MEVKKYGWIHYFPGAVRQLQVEYSCASLDSGRVCCVLGQ